MLSQKSKLTVQIGEKAFEFLCDADSLLGQVHDALAQMRMFVIEQMAVAQKKEVISMPTVQIGEKAFEFLCDADSLLGQVHDALAQMRMFVIEQMAIAQKKEVISMPNEDSSQPKGD